MNTQFSYFMRRARSLELIRELAIEHQLKCVLQRFRYDGFEPGYYPLASPEVLAEEFARGGKPDIYLTLEGLEQLEFHNDNQKTFRVELGQESDTAIALTMVLLHALPKQSAVAPAFRAYRHQIKSLCNDTLLTPKGAKKNIYWHSEVESLTLYSFWENPNSIVTPP